MVWKRDEKSIFGDIEENLVDFPICLLEREGEHVSHALAHLMNIYIFLGNKRK